MGELESRPRSGRIQSVERAVALLRAVAASRTGEATLAGLAERCALNRSTAWRILATLEDHGLIERRAAGYVIGFAAAQLAAASSIDGLVRRAHPVIERLAVVSGETTNLSLARRLGLYYVDQVASTRVESESWLGRQLPLHATSAGKAFLAWLSEAEIGDALPSDLPRFTRSTITDRAALLDELAETRARGYAICAGEMVSDDFGVSAPVLDEAARPVAVVSVWGPSSRVPVSRFAVLGELAQEAAGEVRKLIDVL